MRSLNQVKTIHLCTRSLGEPQKKVLLKYLFLSVSFYAKDTTEDEAFGKNRVDQEHHNLSHQPKTKKQIASTLWFNKMSSPLQSFLHDMLSEKSGHSPIGNVTIVADNAKSLNLARIVLKRTSSIDRLILNGRNSLDTSDQGARWVGKNSNDVSDCPVLPPIHSVTPETRTTKKGKKRRGRLSWLSCEKYILHSE